jgi:hypothetical protein
MVVVGGRHEFADVICSRSPCGYLAQHCGLCWGYEENFVAAYPVLSIQNYNIWWGSIRVPILDFYYLPAAYQRASRHT